MGKGGGMRWTEEQLAAHNNRGGPNARQRLEKDLERLKDAEWDRLAAGLPKRAPQNDNKLLDALVPKPTGKAKLQALGRLRDGSMNKTETAYAAYLDVQKHQGAVLWWAFEGIKLRLADRTHLTIDFAVLDSSGVLKMIDVKGAKAIIEDDARAKTKIAARLFPFQFYFVYPDKASGGWITEEI